MPGWNKNYFILIALFIAFGGANAAAQQALPKIHITHTQAKPKVIAAKPRPPHATPATNPQPSSPSPIASPPSFIASDGRLGHRQLALTVIERPTHLHRQKQKHL